MLSARLGSCIITGMFSPPCREISSAGHLFASARQRPMVGQEAIPAILWMAPISELQRHNSVLFRMLPEPFPAVEPHRRNLPLHGSSDQDGSPTLTWDERSSARGIRACDSCTDYQLSRVFQGFRANRGLLRTWSAPSQHPPSSPLPNDAKPAA